MANDLEKFKMSLRKDFREIREMWKLLNNIMFTIERDRPKNLKLNDEEGNRQKIKEQVENNRNALVESLNGFSTKLQIISARLSSNDVVGEVRTPRKVLKDRISARGTHTSFLKLQKLIELHKRLK